MAWTRNTSGLWTHSGTAREAVIPYRKIAGNASLYAELLAVADEVFVCCLSSQDGRSCFEVGTDATNAIIRRVTFGRRSAAHTPVVDILVDDAHGLGAGVPFYLEARLVDGRIECWINGEIVNSYDNSGSGTQPPVYAQYSYGGFASSVDGARVVGFKICSLLPQRTPRTNRLVVFGGAQCWISAQPGEIHRIAETQIPATAEIDAAEFQQKAYAVGGDKGIIVDPVAETVEAWIPTAGALPGQDQGGGNARPGRTTASIVETHNSRVALSGDSLDPQNIYASAILDPLDYNTGAVTPGAAWGLNAAVRSAKVGAPVRALWSDGIRLVIGCDRALFSLRGDPVTENADLFKITGNDGVTGRDAIFDGPGGSIQVHTTNGFQRIIGDGIANLSAEVLTSLINVADAEVDDYTIIVIRDPKRFGTHIFITTKATPDAPLPSSRHLWHDERAAAVYGGGFFEDRYPDAIGPTCACLHNGEVLLGTRTGYIVKLDDDAATDFDPTDPDNDQSYTATIQSQAALAIIHDASAMRETLVERAEIVLADDANPVKWRAYTGVTAQEAYTGADRALVARGTLTSRKTPLLHRLRGGAIVYELYNDVKGRQWRLERVEATTSGAAILSRRSRTSPTVPPPPCEAPTGSSGGGSQSGSGAASGPGGGSGGFGGSVGGSGGSPGSSASGGGGSAFPGDHGGGAFSGVLSGINEQIDGGTLT